jgi:phosphopantothenoylcysteine synthetase/decarboxylase
MNVVVTAGNTLVPIDKVRCLTNVFTGRTGAALAVHAHRLGHGVTLLTSHPEAAAGAWGGAAPTDERWRQVVYSTFVDLQNLMSRHVGAGRPDVVIHCAAVSDYLSAGIYAPAPGTRFDPTDAVWRADAGGPPALANRAAGKVKSNEPELWLRLVRAPKLIDRVRGDWGFGGLLVKFKLEVGVGDARLLEIAEASRVHSGADLMVANTLEGAPEYAFLGPLGGRYERVERPRLAERLFEVLDRLAGGRAHG